MKGVLIFKVKFHGYRMELEEIDHHLSNSSWVKQAVVVPKYQEKESGTADCLCRSRNAPIRERVPTDKAIKSSLSETVMEYMIPQRFIYVEQLPHTANGKIDRKWLTK